MIAEYSIIKKTPAQVALAFDLPASTIIILIWHLK